MQVSGSGFRCKGALGFRDFRGLGFRVWAV